MRETREPSSALVGGPAVEPSRSRRRPLRLVLAGFIAVAVLAALGFLALATALSVGHARSELLARLSEASGAPVSSAGIVRLAIFPRPRLSVADLTIERPDARIRIESVDAALDPFAALVGRAEISRLSLVRPDIDGLSGEPPRNLADLARSLEPLLGTLTDIPEIEVRDAVVLGAPGVPDDGLKSFSFLVSHDDGEATAIGTAVWNGEPTDFSLEIDAPAAFLSGSRSAMSVSVSAPSLRASFRGSAERGSEPRLEGRLSLSTPSPARLFEWLGDPAVRIPDFGRLALDADIAAAAGRLDMQGAEVVFAGGTGRGAMELVYGAPLPLLSGTLAFAALDLSPIVAALGPQPGDILGLDQPIDVGFLRSFQADLRFSASQAVLGRVTLSDLAATTMLREAALTIDLGDASLLGGRGQARVEVDASLPQPRLTARAAVFDVDAGEALRAVNVSAIAASGRADVTTVIETPLASWPAMTARAQTDATIRARGGSIEGVDLSPLAEPGIHSLQTAHGEGHLPFDTLAARLLGRGLDLRLDSLRLANRTGVLEAAGGITAQAKTVRLEGRFVPEPSVETVGPYAFTPSQPISFTMQGQWPNPDVAVDAPPTPARPTEDASGGRQ